MSLGPRGTESVARRTGTVTLLAAAARRNTGQWVEPEPPRPQGVPKRTNLRMIERPISGKVVRPEAADVARPADHTLNGATLGSGRFIRIPMRESPRCRHNHSVSEPGVTRQPDRSRLGWLGRRPPNWWLRFAIPFLTIFGGGFVFRILSGRTDEPWLYLYGTGAALAIVALVVGLIKVKRSAG
jgi:hypothetical protein